MAMIERIKGICLKPKTEWDAIAEEGTSTAELFKGYAVPLAAIPPIAGFIGGSRALGLGIMIGGTGARKVADGPRSQISVDVVKIAHDILVDAEGRHHVLVSRGEVLSALHDGLDEGLIIHGLERIGERRSIRGA